MAARPCSALVVALALLVNRAEAEVYKLTKEDVPPYTLTAQHLFYVDASPATSRSRDHAKGLVLEEDEAHVFFEDFRATSIKLASQEDASMTLQVGLIPWEAFDELVDKTSFCDAKGRISLYDRAQKKDVRILDVPFGKMVTQQMKIETTGVYVAFVANCDKGDGLQISGAFSVKGSTGFLPANRQGAFSLFGWCLVLHIIAGLTWVALLARNRKHLHEPHFAIACFIAFGVGEAVCYRQHLGEIMDRGESAAWLEKLSETMSIMKTGYLYAVLMLLCCGVGLTPADEYSTLKWKLLGFTSLFSTAIAPKICMFDYRHSDNLSDGAAFLSMLPAVLVTLGSIAWGMQGALKTMARCKDLKYDGTLRVLQRVVVMIGILLIVAAGVLSAQLLDKPGRGEMWWSYHMSWSNVASEVVHFIALVALIVLCRPSQATFRADTYTASAEDEMQSIPCAQDDDDGAGILDLDELNDEEVGPMADTIGAPVPLGVE